MASPKGFEKRDIDSLFLRNAGQYIIIFYLLSLCYMFLWIFYKIFEWLTKNKNKFHKVTKYSKMAV